MTQLALEIRPRPRVLSYGGGVDSFAVLLRLIALGEPPDAVAFVDVSDGSPEADPTDPGEWPGTYKHIREVVIPLCRRHGIAFVWIDTTRYPVRDARSLFAWLLHRGQVPVAGPDRICTMIAKVERFEAWMSATYPGLEVTVLIGFEAGEEDRAANDPNAGTRRKRKVRPTDAKRVNEFPLIAWGWCRCRAVAYIEQLGYPVPRKSACMGCCYNSMTDWQTLKREVPAVFDQYADLEARKPLTAAGVKISITGFKMGRPRQPRPEAMRFLMQVAPALGDAALLLLAHLEHTSMPVRSRSLVLVDKRGRVYQAPPLPEYVKGKAQGSRTPCTVCGAPERATKAVGCGYLKEAA